MPAYPFNTALRVLRTITPKECPWLDTEVKKNTVVFITSDVYNLCRPGDIYVKLHNGKDIYPGFQIPADAVEETVYYPASRN